MEHEKLDLEKLNKSQLVLLTLLVSFMTSIATGIVTVSLMQQAPTGVTEVVNRVVERTVEKIVPGQVASAAASDTKTVPVQESEVIPKALEAASPSVVRVFSSDASSTSAIGLGVVLDTAGTIATDAAALGEIKEFQVEIAGNVRVPARIERVNNDTGVALITAEASTTEGKITWKPAKLSEKTALLGQTVILITGRSSTRVAQGLVTSFSVLAAEGATEGVLETNVPEDVIIFGSPIIDTSGAVLGVSTQASRTSNKAGFVASGLIKSVPKETKAENQ